MGLNSKLLKQLRQVVVDSTGYVSESKLTDIIDEKIEESTCAQQKILNDRAKMLEKSINKLLQDTNTLSLSFQESNGQNTSLLAKAGIKVADSRYVTVEKFNELKQQLDDLKKMQQDQENQYKTLHGYIHENISNNISLINSTFKSTIKSLQNKVLELSEELTKLKSSKDT